MRPRDTVQAADCRRSGAAVAAELRPDSWPAAVTGRQRCDGPGGGAARPGGSGQSQVVAGAGREGYSVMAQQRRKITVDFSRLRELVNDTFWPLLWDEHRYLVLKGGGSSGKSVFAAQKLIYRAVAEKERNKFLIVRKVKQDLRDSCFAELVHVIEAWGMRDLFQIPAGRSSELYLRCKVTGTEFIFYGLDDVERRKSIQGITGIWIEEASELEFEDFLQLDIRLRGKTKTYQQILLTFNPVSATHWLKRHFFDQQQPDTTTHHSTYKDNRFLDEVNRRVLESFKGVDDYHYTVYCLGQWGVVGQTVYNARIVTERLAELEGQEFIRGDFIYRYEGEKIVDRSITFVENDAGMVMIYEPSRPGYPYVIGGDVAEGGEDYCTGSVRDNTTWRQAATFRGRMDTDLYAKQMYCLGRFYNDALIAIEVNFDLHPVKELDRLGYSNQYMREEMDQISKKLKKKWGFRTTRITRPAIISKHVALAREHIRTFQDRVLLDEMLTFVRNEDGRPEAKEGAHDDMIFADAICLEVREQQSMDVPKEEKPKPLIREHKDRLAQARVRPAVRWV